MVTGQKVKEELGLQNFKYVYIQTVLGLAQKIYIVAFDSKFPTSAINHNMIKRYTRLHLKKFVRLVGDDMFFKSFTLTPPSRLETYSGDISNQGVILLMDMAVLYFRNDKMFTR